MNLGYWVLGGLFCQLGSAGPGVTLVLVLGSILK
jgi:hypothetical protein